MVNQVSKSKNACAEVVSGDDLNNEGSMLVGVAVQREYTCVVIESEGFRLQK